MIKKVMSLLCIAAIIISFAGCGVSGNQDFPVTVGHTSFEKEVGRAVVLSDNAADILLQLGYNSRITGKSDECTQEELNDVKSFGKKDEPNVDKIVSENPDVVIADSTLKDSKYNNLLEKNIKVLRFVSPSTKEDLSIMYQKLNSLFEGKLTGSENGKEAFENFWTTIENNPKSLPDIPVPKTVCYLYDYKGKTVTGDMLGNVIFSSAGALNIASSATGGKIDIKTIQQENPQYIFCDIGMSKKLAKNTDFKDLLAVKNKRVVEIPSADFSRGGVSMLSAIKTITDTLYPNGKAGSVADSYGIKYDKDTFFTVGDGADNDEDDTYGNRDTIIIIQTRLDDLGYWPLNEMTGYYGDTTAIAVADFQSANGMEYQSGEVDYETLEKMFSDDAVSRSEPVEKQETE
ncbi:MULTISPECIES: ABC transporter substrate-binding protein [unclassified Ruminococcus]|uniref:ABC transporter substrate-binding protein n=1 Tax=unclassified Ruminococcus TaxID=2608920 RepID=UPI00210A8370|nr:MULTISPECIES: ABC transporter substrate-binding protein [unclassified Ruminococcus]MCQ4021974.1 ABC transporter substrate-binding protein [Ruminococcus sp. zg-924]MCQ4114510.1 ABC transporter substrate-binding protein [Ruminococcus sp. zg-921]